MFNQCLDLLEEEMATHSSIRAWRIPCTEEPGSLQSMGSQELDLATKPQNQPVVGHIVCKYLLPSIGCLFVLSIVSLAVLKLFSLM